MGINGVNANYGYYNRRSNGYNNFSHKNYQTDSPIFTGLNKTGLDKINISDSFQNSQTITPKDGKDDGSIGFVGAVGNLFKGVGNFFKGMVCDENGKFSITRTLTTLCIGAAIGVACTMLPAITIAGTAISTLGLISAGFLGFAGVHAGGALFDILGANTDAEATKAWQDMGSALTEGGLAYLGYRASGGILAKDVVPPASTGSTPKTPKTEPTAETAKAEPVVKTKPVAEEAVTEQHSMTMTDEARVQYDRTKAKIEKSRPKIDNEFIDAQFKASAEYEEIQHYMLVQERLGSLEKTVGDETHLSFTEQMEAVNKVVDKHVPNLDGLSGEGIAGGHYSELYIQLAERIKGNFKDVDISKFKREMSKKNSLKEYTDGNRNINVDVNIIAYDGVNKTVTLKIGNDTGVVSFNDNKLRIGDKNIDFDKNALKSMRNKLENLNTCEAKIKRVKSLINSSPNIKDAAISEEGVISIKFKSQNKLGIETEHTLELRPYPKEGTGTIQVYEQWMNGVKLDNPKTTVPKEEMDVVLNAIRSANKTNRLQTYKAPSPIDEYASNVYYIKYKNNYYLIACPDAQIASVYPILESALRSQISDITKIPQLENQAIYKGLSL